MSNDKRENRIIKNADDLRDCFSVDILAGYLDISRCKAYGLVKSDGFPRIEIGKRIVIPKEPFLQWLESQTVTSVNEAATR